VDKGDRGASWANEKPQPDRMAGAKLQLGFSAGRVPGQAPFQETFRPKAQRESTGGVRSSWLSIHCFGFANCRGWE